jgi:hypothetical protein
MTSRVVREQNVAMSPAGLKIKNDCAGEAQQKFTRPTETVKIRVLLRHFMFVSSLLLQDQIYVPPVLPSHVY